MTPPLVVCGSGWSVLGDAPGPRLWVQHGPGPADLVALQGWLRRGCSGPAPIRQGFAAVLREADGSVRAAVSSRLETCLMYVVDRERLLVGHHPRDVVTSLEALPPLNVQKLVDLMALYDEPTTTVYQGVHRLPIGHHLLWHRGMSMPTVSRWFDPTQLEPLRIKPSDAPGLMREVIRDAVGASLPATGDVAATLSGGLDSSMVVATAASILHPQGRTVHCATHRPLPGTPDPSPTWEADDGPYAERMCREVPGLTWRGLVNENWTTPLEADFSSTWYPSLNPANTAWIQQLIRWTEEASSPLLLTGATGNAPFSRDRGGLIRQLAGHDRYAAIIRDLWRRRQDGAAWRHAARRTAGDAAPEWARRIRERTTSAPDRQPRFRDIMPMNLALLSPQARAWVTFLESPRRTRKDWVDFVLRDASVATVPLWLSDQVWWSDPLSDPEVETLALRLPHEAWLLGSETRPLARRSMVGLVPDHIRLRTTRGAQAADVGMAPIAERTRHLREAAEAFESSAVCRRVIDLASLRGLAADPSTIHPGIWRDTVVRALGFGSFVLWYESIIDHDPVGGHLMR